METILKFIFNVFELVVILKVALFVTRLFTGRSSRSNKKRSSKKERSNNSILYRLYILAINPIIYKLDDLIYDQKQKRLEVLQERRIISDNNKVISFKTIQKHKDAK